MSSREDTRDMLETTVAGIPCYAKAETVTIVAPWSGSPRTCPSADDYYGYAEVEFTIYDRKGYDAAWLAKKLTGDDIERIEQALIEREKNREPEWL
jgi:hypothetical protein